MKVLVIDDNADTASMLSKFLELKGHSCVTADNGKNGLALIDSKNFDVLLLDLAMPEFTGYDVLEELAKNNNTKKLKTIVFTASTLRLEDENTIKEKGVRTILRKPIELKFLLEALEE